jgi:hypothetical protein
MGAMTVAVEPEIHAAALQVPGAGFVQFITTSSAKVSPLVSTIATGTFGIQGDEVLDEYHPVGLLLGADHRGRRPARLCAARPLGPPRGQDPSRPPHHLCHRRRGAPEHRHPRAPPRARRRPRGAPCGPGGGRAHDRVPRHARTAAPAPRPPSSTPLPITASDMAGTIPGSSCRASRSTRPLPSRSCPRPSRSSSRSASTRRSS